MNEWISVKDKFPEDYEFVLVAALGKGTGEPCSISIGRFNSGIPLWQLLKKYPNNACACGDLIWDMQEKGVTHWMPLPEPPNE